MADEGTMGISGGTGSSRENKKNEPSMGIAEATGASQENKKKGAE
jgi:hypothetical protein